MRLVRPVSTVAVAVALVAPGLTAQGALQNCPDIPRYTADQVDDYHGAQARDPYRWLENVDSDSTRRWIEAENCRTFAWRLPGRRQYVPFAALHG